MTSAHALRRATLVAVSVLALAATCGACSSAGSSAPTTSSVASTKAAVGAPVRSAGCNTAAAAAVTGQRQDIEVGGVDRWYLMTTPAPSTTSPPGAGTRGSASPAARPLVLDFHGLEEGASLHTLTSRFGELGQKDGFVVAFPQGTGNPVQWDTTSHGAGNADLTFVTAILNHLEETQCIDTSRVYASGFSDGAFMVSQLACTMSARFAAIAAVSGLQLPGPARPPALCPS